MVVLAHQRVNQRDQITLEGEPGNNSFVKWFFRLQKNIDGDFQPRAFGPLSGMIKSGEFSSLKRAFNPRVGNKRYESDPFNAPGMFTRKAVEGLLDQFLGAFW